MIHSRKKTYFSASLSITNLTLAMSGLNPSHSNETPARYTMVNSNSAKLEVYIVHLTHYVIIFRVSVHEWGMSKKHKYQTRCQSA